MDNFLEAIKKSLENENWYAALGLSLILPDICGKLEYKSEGKKRYIDWLNENIFKSGNFISGNDAYALRCAFLHQGGDDTTTQSAKEFLEKFLFFDDNVSAHNNVFTGCFLKGQSIKNTVQLKVKDFCLDICNTAEKWFNNFSTQKGSEESIGTFLKINKKGDVINGIKYE